MPTTLHRPGAEGAAPTAAPRLRPDELAVRVHALRRARRDARTRASRVRRVLLAPTPVGDTYAQVPETRHQHWEN
ncbi:hypothetical protein [Actinomadura chibensis]|uniref:Uncharacterized protein n=1 Tax=Actinomadura chibensis TaxID=392828 RepID=A0A5D0NR26_9ACTN|nr:hypothetical protein [Actinomadura chibensis]TYB46759.1 hypothetical protein FXF69_16320 [Actinomadura chibensis]